MLSKLKEGRGRYISIAQIRIAEPHRLRRFAEDRLAGLADESRVGRPKVELVMSVDERAQLGIGVLHEATSPPTGSLSAALKLVLTAGSAPEPPPLPRHCCST